MHFFTLGVMIKWAKKKQPRRGKMCIIAGYSGKKQAAPILIEMLKKSEYVDGGLSTGIATIHEGKLYTAKVVGDVDVLLRESDAINLPGTTGIIHSRTGNNHISHAHPFTDDVGELALVLNGTSWGGGTEEFYELSNSIMNGFYDRGITIKSAIEAPNSKRRLKDGKTYHDTEPYALMIGDAVKDSAPETIKNDIANATRMALETLPIDVIVLNIHSRLPDTITLGSISRPMSFGFGDGEMYLATVPWAFPEEIGRRPVMFLPPTSIAQVTPSGLNILSTAMDGVRVEQIDTRLQRVVRESMEELLGDNADGALSIYDMPFEIDREWSKKHWYEPMVDSKFKPEGEVLKPSASLMYECLWSFYREGRLHFTDGKMKSGAKITKFWIDK